MEIGGGGGGGGVGGKDLEVKKINLAAQIDIQPPHTHIMKKEATRKMKPTSKAPSRQSPPAYRARRSVSLFSVSHSEK